MATAGVDAVSPLFLQALSVYTSLTTAFAGRDASGTARQYEEPALLLDSTVLRSNSC